MVQPSNKAMGDDVQAAGESLADQAEAALQQAIIQGEIEPDARLTIPALEARFGIGATPLREGLSRLVARGLVTMIGNRGFRVAPVSREDLEDIIRTRCVLETGALRLSMDRRDGDWEDTLVSAMHRLKRTITQAGNSIHDDAPHDAAHRAFHQALIGGSGSWRLTQLQGSLFDQAYRYRRVMRAHGLDLKRDLAVHQHLIDLALGSDIDAACEALTEHIRLTLETFEGGK